MKTQTGINPWREALDLALNELSQAEQAFEWADADYCDYHIFRIQAAEAKVALIVGQARIALGYSSTTPALTKSPLQPLTMIAPGTEETSSSVETPL